jgi:hypothetical protein
MAGADSGTDRGAGPGWRWDVALSFAAAQRGYVEQVAGALQARGVRCFYDADEQVRLRGTHLAVEPFAALRHACHYHPYELAPTAAELTGWLDQAAQIVTQLQTATAAPATQT